MKKALAFAKKNITLKLLGLFPEFVA